MKCGRGCWGQTHTVSHRCYHHMTPRRILCDVMLYLFSSGLNWGWEDDSNTSLRSEMGCVTKKSSTRPQMKNGGNRWPQSFCNDSQWDWRFIITHPPTQTCQAATVSHNPTHKHTRQETSYSGFICHVPELTQHRSHLKSCTWTLIQNWSRNVLWPAKTSFNQAREALMLPCLLISLESFAHPLTKPFPTQWAQKHITR